MDVDLVVGADLENEAKVFGALSMLPDNAARELKPGELQQYNVVRGATLRYLRSAFDESRSFDRTRDTQ